MQSEVWMNFDGFGSENSVSFEIHSGVAFWWMFFTGFDFVFRTNMCPTDPPKIHPDLHTGFHQGFHPKSTDKKSTDLVCRPPMLSNIVRSPRHARHGTQRLPRTGPGGPPGVGGSDAEGAPPTRCNVMHCVAVQYTVCSIPYTAPSCVASDHVLRTGLVGSNGCIAPLYHAYLQSHHVTQT